MRTIAFFCLAVILFFCSCKQNSTTPSNDLTFNQVEAHYQISWNQADTFRIYGFDTSFSTLLHNAAISNKLMLCDFPISSPDFDSLDAIDSDDLGYLKNDFTDSLLVTDTVTKKSQILTKNYNAYRNTDGLFFVENWLFNKEQMIFTKDVKMFAPIMTYTRQGKQIQTPMYLLDQRKIVPQKENLQALGKNLRYYVNVNNNDAFRKITGFNAVQFTRQLINDALKGKYKLYDFFAEGKKEIGIDEVKRNFYNEPVTRKIRNKSGVVEEKQDTVLFYNEQILGLMFIENWYYDKESFSIKKEVLGFGPALEFYTESGIRIKKIPFIIYLDEKKQAN